MHRMKSLLTVTAALFLAITIAACGTPEPKLSPRDEAFNLCEEANIVHWGKNWNAVISLTTRAIALDPDFPWPYSLRGAAHNAQKSYDKALKDLNHALALAPDFQPAVINRGITYLRTKDFKKAEKDFAFALKLNSKDLVSIVSMAETKSALDNPQAACDLIQKAMKLGFNDLEAIEQSDNFTPMLYHKCFQDVIRLQEEMKKPAK